MLYITTRNNTDAFTHPHALSNSRSTDGGFYVPFHLPAFTGSELDALKNCSFGETVSKILNLFFNAGLDAGDVDFCIGRTPVRAVNIGQRFFVCETWHNPDANYDYMIKQLSGRIWFSTQEASFWLSVAIRIAVHFSTYGQMISSGYLQEGKTYDIAVHADDPYDLPAVFYAKQMGLPVGMIICGCIDDVYWSLLNRGTLSTKNLSDAVKDSVENLLYCVFGCSAASEFARCCHNGISYSVSAEQKEMLSKVMFAAVVTDNRVDSVISSVYKTNNYILDTKCVAAYAAAQDYRTRAGESRTTLFCADASPIHDRIRICRAANITADQLDAVINKS